MTDKPIPFSGPMVRALIAGRKTQTRRVLKPQPFADGYYDGEVDCTFVPAPASNRSAYFRFGASAVGGGAVRTEIHEPRYEVGDRLYVREAWKTHAEYDDLAPSEMGGEEPIQYQADGAHQTWGYPGITKIGRFRHGMHMPRWASRLTLIVTDVRVQRVQEISTGDCLAEGIEANEAGLVLVQGSLPLTAKAAYRGLWDSLNAKRGFGWDANPWVVAATFTLHVGNIDTIGEAA